MRTKAHRVELTDEERAELFVLIRRGKAPARTLTRAHILLRASEDTYDWATADALHVSRTTVERVRRRFAAAAPGERLHRALYDQPHPGAAPKLDAKAEAQLIALACTAPPDKRTVWTMQLLADTLVELHVIEAISDETVRRTLGKKQAQAVAERALVYAGDGRRVRRGHGGRARPLR